MSEKPEPSVDVWNRPFWDACREKRLTVQRCANTGKCWFPPAPVSPFDPMSDWNWVECSGNAEVISWVVFHQKYFAGFADELPYNVAMVQLEEGPVLVTNIQADNDAVHIGMPVAVTFEDRGDFTVPLFEPRAVQ